MNVHNIPNTTKIANLCFLKTGPSINVVDILILLHCNDVFI